MEEVLLYYSQILKIVGAIYSAYSEIYLKIKCLFYALGFHVLPPLISSCPPSHTSIVFFLALVNLAIRTCSFTSQMAHTLISFMRKLQYLIGTFLYHVSLQHDKTAFLCLRSEYKYKLVSSGWFDAFFTHSYWSRWKTHVKTLVCLSIWKHEWVNIALEFR